MFSSDNVSELNMRQLKSLLFSPHYREQENGQLPADIDTRKPVTNSVLPFPNTHTHAHMYATGSAICSKITTHEYVHCIMFTLQKKRTSTHSDSSVIYILQ